MATAATAIRVDAEGVVAFTAALVRVDGRLYGRGSADMKSGVAAMLYGTRALQLAGPFPGAVRLLALSDEEGMMLGVKHAVASGALDGVAGVIVCEPEGDEVCPSSKGPLRLGIELHGRMAHGAMPDQGRNPLRVLGRLLEALGRMQDDLTSTSPRRRSAATHGSTRKRPVPFSRAPSPILPIRRTGRRGSDSGSAAA